MVLGGRLTAQERTLIENAGLRAFDYAAAETFALRNAVPTAEGAIQIAMQELPVVLHRLPVLILGAGRVSRALQPRLRALGAEVTVAARRCTDLARSKGDVGKPGRQCPPAVPEPDSKVLRERMEQNKISPEQTIGTNSAVTATKLIRSAKPCRRETAAGTARKKEGSTARVLPSVYFACISLPALPRHRRPRCHRPECRSRKHLSFCASLPPRHGGSRPSAHPS